MTPAEIRNEAAKSLNILGEGQTLRAEHTTDLDNAYLEVHAELQSDGIAYWSSTASVPTKLQWSVIAIVAASMLTEYNIPLERANVILADETKAWKKLWKMSMYGKMGQTRVVNF